MPTFEITSPDGRKFQVTAPEGASQEEILNYAKANMPVAKQAGSALNDIPRQVGLTARYGIEGLANGLQVGTEPIRYVTDRLFGFTGKTKPLGALASDFADTIGLPKPQNANERVVGDASRLVAGTMSTMGAGNLANGLKGTVTEFPKAASQLTQTLNDAANAARQTVGGFFTQAPAVQVSSAAGAGLAGGASREAGGNEFQQGASALIGGVLAGQVPGAANGVKTFAKTLLSKPSAADLDIQITGILSRAGVDYSQIPEKVRQGLRQELQSALIAGKDLDPKAVARLADFKAAGLTPTRGMVSLDPVQITREQNLAKIAANSADGELHGLPRLQNQNNSTLIGNLNNLGADRGDLLTAGNRVTSSVFGTQAGLRGAEQAAWGAAKSSPGYKQPISSGVLSDINKALGDEGLMPFMNPTISKYMEAFQGGQPFTPQAYRNLQSMLAREVAKGGNEGAAAGLARRILEQSDLRPAGFTGAPGSVVTSGMAGQMRNADNAATGAIDAVNQARQATRTAYAYEDSNPLVRSVLSGGASSDPQRIAQRYIIGGTLNEARDLANQVGPQGIPVIRDALLAHIKQKALNGANDEVGKFSQSAFNKAMKDMGPKLQLFFSKEEIDQLEAMGRAASYMQAQPVGSAVNNSNSGALLLGRGLDALNGLASKLPFGQQMIVDPVKNIGVSIRQKQAQDVIGGLLNKQEKPNPLQPYLLPGVIAGGLLSAP